ncbi:D-alanyl-D-alanine carboxypeptidase [Streptococcus sp. DD10]|uniref:LD-carboxypeptidase LdcB/DacB n=1 Tax=Streptococcus sp. DD10 TaxID=1777878 RepID=UPI00079B0374|nr:LD-carboxypeptidase LdcB/DacB [Streptococcus sp. DD10]KXT74599.1 D-alanyl-D-alanine carboxypeptidase [Streptococcus sp. DD10]
MKKRIGLILLSSLFLLTACAQASNSQSADGRGKSDAATVEGTAPTVENAQELSETSSDDSKESTSPSMDKGVHFNGHYYSVQGKYGEIMIANKHYPLAADFNPGEDPTAVAALHQLIAAMQEQGYPISDQYSGFRSYDTQAALYQNYVNQDGREAADRYSARPGYSEHQTGLAFDLIDTNGNLVQESAASKWLLDNAADYGFVVRYLSGKESSTGYMHEEWHLRYIGREAQDIAKSGKTLEEYYGFTGGDYTD